MVIFAGREHLSASEYLPWNIFHAIKNTGIQKKLAAVIMTPAMLSAMKTGGCVFSIGFSQQHIPSQPNSLTTIQLLFLR